MNAISKCFAAIAAVSAGLLVGATALAHHNGANTYMTGQPVKWDGTVTFVSWDGAHVMYRIDVKNVAGVVESWQVLGGSPYRLAKRGINKQTLHIGDVVTVAGYLDVGSRIVTPVYLLPSDGQKLFVGYLADDAMFKLPPLN